MLAHAILGGYKVTEMEFDLEKYLSSSAKDIIGEILKGSWQNRSESMFIAKCFKNAKKAEKKRDEHEAKGESAPPFLIANVTESCNLRCSGCWLRMGMDERCAYGQNADAKWGRVFDEACGIGVSVMLISGGEPLSRRGVIEEAAKRGEMLFPILTNGTMIDDEYLRLFNERRNLIPVLSIEGDERQMDGRRGSGVHSKVFEAMRKLGKNGIIYGCSISITRDNLDCVTGRGYISHLKELGCKAAVMSEYSPPCRPDLALNADSRERLSKRVQWLRSELSKMIIIQLPGDKRLLDSCLAEGRGLFCISPPTEARACPFSPFSDMSLWQSFPKCKSPFFDKLKESGLLAKKHVGGGFSEKKGLVKSILGSQTFGEQD
jgi:MoaA/NifB/PqqE/SkfB family radical SAM enzyme